MTEPLDNSILVVSGRKAFVGAVSDMLKSGGFPDVSTEASGLAELNGHAAEVIGHHNAVIFEVSPDGDADLTTLSSLARQSEKPPAFFAIASDAVTIAKAHKLREAGVRDVLPISIREEELRHAIANSLHVAETTLPAKPAAAATGNAMVIAVAQARGGAGATTCAVNLAAQLAGPGQPKRKGRRRVALVDLDLQFGNAAFTLDVACEHNLVDLLDSDEPLTPELLERFMHAHPSGIDLLAAPDPIAPLTSLSPDRIDALLRVLRTTHDVVVLDMPRAMVDWIEPIIKQLDLLMLVTDTTVPSIRHTKRIIDFYHETNIGLPVRLLVNREERGFFKSERQREAETVLEMPLDIWIPENTKLTRQASDLGVPITMLQPKSKIAKAIRKVVASINGLLPAETARRA